MGLGEAAGAIGQEHDPELADDHVERGVRERERLRIRRLQ